MNDDVEYVGKDLEAMDFAVNYHKWILSLIRPFLGKHLVEVGAGTGSFSEMLLQTSPKTLTLVEPSEMYEILSGMEFISGNRVTEVTTYKNIFANIAESIKRSKTTDTMIYVNVLEHISDDAHEIGLVHDTLEKNGRLIVFVPALSFLYSEFDKHIGHFRRYSKRELVSKCEAAHFKIIFARYFDLPGILPWLIKYRIFRSLKMESGAVQLYDRSVVPIAKILESVVAPPLGKNLLLVAEKT